MQILITGASGFVGQNLMPYLKNNALDCSPFSLRGNWEKKLLHNYTAIIHLAGKAHDTKKSSSPDEYFHINTALTKRLFDHFLRSDVQDFVYFSSVKAVADTVDNILDEEVDPNPQTPYGQSKWQAEQYLNNQQLPVGKRLFIFRPCMIHGPGNKGNLNLLYQLVSKGAPWPLAAFDNKRSFLSVDNLNFVVKRILANPEIQGGTYNLADDDRLSTNELIKLIGEAQERKVRFWKVSRRLFGAAARLGDVLHLPLNSERLKKLTESYVVDNSKVKSALKIEKFPITAKEGLLKTLRSF